MKVESGTGNGFYARVTRENALAVSAATFSRQHFVSKTDQKAFQIIGEATAASGTVNVLYLGNNTADQTFTVTYIRLAQIDLAGGTALPNSSNYFDVVGGLTYSSGGSQVTPVNCYINSVATVTGTTGYTSNPTLTGTAGVLEKHWAKEDGEEVAYSKEGSVIIPPGSALTVRYTGDHTSGSLYSRISYYATDINSFTE